MPKSASRIWQRWCVPSSFPTVQPLLEMGRYGFLWFFNGFIDQIGMITHTCIYIIKHHTVYIYILLLYYIILFFYDIYYVILGSIMLYYIIFYCIILYFIVLYYIILYYIILYIIIIIIILIHIRILFINYDSHHHHHHCDTDQNLWYSLCILYI